MIEANPVTYDARNLQATIPAMAARAVTGRPKLAAVRAYSLPAADAAADGWQAREKPEYYIPDFLFNEDYEPNPELMEAADAHSEDSGGDGRLLPSFLRKLPKLDPDNFPSSQGE